MRLLNRLKTLRNTREPEREETASHPSISTTDAYAILRLERRRHIIDYLTDHEPGAEVTASELSDHLEVLGDQRDSAYVSVIQSHLPRMARSQLIEYDSDDQVVRSTEALYRLHDAHRAFEKELNTA